MSRKGHSFFLWRRFAEGTRWRKAVVCESNIHPASYRYERYEGEEVAERLRRTQASRESYFELRLGVKARDLQQKCVLEIGGAVLADELLFNVNARHKIVVDPLPWPVLSSDCHILRGIGERIPLKTSSIDFCWTTNTIDHCADPGQFLSEIRRALGVDGRLWITCNVFAWWTRPLFPLFDFLDGPHPHHFTRSSFLGLLVRTGFSPEFEMNPWIPRIRKHRRALSVVKTMVGKMAGLKTVRVRCFKASGQTTGLSSQLELFDSSDGDGLE